MAAGDVAALEAAVGGVAVAERLGVLGHRRQQVEQAGRRRAAVAGAEVEVRQAALEEARQHAADRMGIPQQREAVARLDGAQRSEEHTSELQSLMRNTYAGLCLKKKKQHIIRDTLQA